MSPGPALALARTLVSPMGDTSAGVARKDLHVATWSVEALVKEATPAGAWSAIVSAPTLDRDGDVIDAGAFNPLPPRVPVHDRHFGDLVGSARPYYQGLELAIDGVFASTPKAQDMRTLVLEGHLTTMSVVFLRPKTRHVDGVRHITSAELLAVDWAPIPSNLDTAVLVARSHHWRRSSVGPAALVAARALADLAAFELRQLDRATVREAERLLRTPSTNSRGG